MKKIFLILLQLICVFSVITFGEKLNADDLLLSLSPDQEIPDSRIIGGGIADISNFPYMLSLRHFGHHVCGAVIISNFWSLTAAHCLIGSFAPFQLSIRGGSTSRTTGGTLFSVLETVMHPEFNPFTMENDIGLVRVNVPFIGVNIAAIPLGVQSTLIPPMSMGSFSGWGVNTNGGYIFSDNLNYVQLQVVELELCRNSLDPFTNITDRMICAGIGFQDKCIGDLGGPLVINGRIEAISSFLIGCGDTRWPGVYTRIASAQIRHFIRTYAGV